MADQQVPPIADANGAPPPPPPPPPQVAPLNLQSFKRDTVLVLIATGLSVLIAIAIYHYFLLPPEIDWKTIASKDIVELVFNDSYWFHELYVRWTLVDWFLAFLATGTALSATIKNSVSVKTAGATDLSKWDLALIVLAICAVLGTTFDAKIHAGQLADKYRAGDLILQEGKIDYAGSSKDADAKKQLVKKWHDAQSILESTVVVKAAATGDQAGNSTNKPDGKDQTKDQTQGANTHPPTPAPKPPDPKPDGTKPPK